MKRYASVNRSDPVRVGKYRVRLDDLERVGIQSLRRAVVDPQIAAVVIDEIGKICQIRFFAGCKEVNCDTRCLTFEHSCGMMAVVVAQMRVFSSESIRRWLA